MFGFDVGDEVLVFDDSHTKSELGIIKKIDISAIAMFEYNLIYSVDLLDNKKIIQVITLCPKNKYMYKKFINEILNKMTHKDYTKNIKLSWCNYD